MEHILNNLITNLEAHSSANPLLISSLRLLCEEKFLQFTRLLMMRHSLVMGKLFRTIDKR